MRRIVFTIISCFVLNIAYPSTLDSIPEPEFMNEVYYYDKVNLKLLPLENSTAEMKTKMKMIGASGPAYSINGDKSFIRLTEEVGSFMISIPNGTMMDPSTTIKLYRFESKKGRREAAISYGGMNSAQRNSNIVDIKFKKVKEGTYEIVIPRGLDKGEYGFMNMHSMNTGGGMATYAFGVD